MSLLIEIDVKNGLVLRPEVMKLVDSFSALTEKEMLSVVLFADYSSVYKQFPEHERKRKAMQHAFDDNIPKLFESQKMKDAIQDYMRLQYSPKIELARKYQEKITAFSDSMEHDTSPSSIKKTIEAITALRQSILGLEQEIDNETLNEGVIKGKMTLSWLEKIQSNMKQYDKLIKNK